MLRAAHHGVLAVAKQLDENFDFDGIELVLPTTLFDDRYVLDLDGTEVHLIYVGPAHQVGDVIVHVPSEGVLFAGDLLFNQSTPMGWVGSYQEFSDALDRIINLDPATIVPGHGPVCGIEAVRDEQAYFQHVLDESRKCFDQGLTSKQAAERINLDRYGEWKAPARLVINVERAYREFRGEQTDAPGTYPRSSTACITSRGQEASRSSSESSRRQEGGPTISPVTFGGGATATAHNAVICTSRRSIGIRLSRAESALGARAPGCRILPVLTLRIPAAQAWGCRQAGLTGMLPSRHRQQKITVLDISKWIARHPPQVSCGAMGAPRGHQASPG